TPSTSVAMIANDISFCASISAKIRSDDMIILSAVISHPIIVLLLIVFRSILFMYFVLVYHGKYLSISSKYLSKIFLPIWYVFSDRPYSLINQCHILPVPCTRILLIFDSFWENNCI